MESCFLLAVNLTSLMANNIIGFNCWLVSSQSQYDNGLQKLHCTERVYVVQILNITFKTKHQMSITLILKLKK